MGESAGGHLVAMLGTTSGKKVFDVGENLNYTSDINCVVNLFGVSDFSRLPSVAGALLGAEDKANPDLIGSISPITYVHKDEPPMLIVHGTDDKLVPYEQAQILASAMDKVKAHYHFHTVVGGGHNPYFGLNTNSSTGNFDAGGGGIGIFADRDVEPLIAAFLRHYLLEKRSDGFWGLPVGKPAANE
jgi:acetyl esterase/lipase